MGLVDDEQAERRQELAEDRRSPRGLAVQEVDEAVRRRHQHARPGEDLLQGAVMRQEVLGVAAPEADEGDRADLLRRLPDLAKAGAGLLAELLGVGEPEDGPLGGEIALAVVAVEEPEGDALDRHPGLAAAGGEGHDAAPAERLLESFEESALDLALERLQRFQPEAPLQVLDVRQRLGCRDAGELPGEAGLEDEVGGRGLPRMPSLGEMHRGRPRHRLADGDGAEEVDAMLENEGGGELALGPPPVGALGPQPDLAQGIEEVGEEIFEHRMGEEVDEPLDGAPLPPLAEQEGPGRRLVREPAPPVPRREPAGPRRPRLDVRIAREPRLDLPVLLLPEPPGFHHLRLRKGALILDGAGDFCEERELHGVTREKFYSISTFRPELAG